jgi:hypothetical protein
MDLGRVPTLKGQPLSTGSDQTLRRAVCGLYQMLTGHLPFDAADPLEWVHCHIARQPIPPGDRIAAKNPKERYQTAAGIEADLQHCLAERKTKGRIDLFALRVHDVPDRLLIPQKLYGRGQGRYSACGLRPGRGPRHLRARARIRLFCRR